MPTELTARITVRFLPADLDRIRESARNGNLRLAEFIRARALGLPVRPPLPTLDAQAVSQLRSSIGLIKQIFKEKLVDPNLTRQYLIEASKTVVWLRTQGARRQREAGDGYSQD